MDPPEMEETFLAVTRGAALSSIIMNFQQRRTCCCAVYSAGESLSQAMSRLLEAESANLDRLEANLMTWFRDWTAEGFFLAVDVR